MVARRCVALLLLALSAADALRVGGAGRVPGPLQLSVSKFQAGAVCARCRPPTMTSSSENAAMICFIASRACSFTTGFCFDTTGGRATY